MRRDTQLTLQGLALHQIEVIRLLQYAALEATAQALQVAVVNVEHKSRAVHIIVTYTRTLTQLKRVKRYWNGVAQASPGCLTLFVALVRLMA